MRFAIVDTLPRHLLPKSPKVRAQQISAKEVLHPMYREQADLNPFIHRNQSNERERYEEPLAVRLSNKLKISKEKIAKILEEHPSLCHTQNPEKEIEEICTFLSESFGGDSFMRTMIMRQPLLLDCDIPYLQHQIAKILEHLSDHVIDDDNCDKNKAKKVEFVTDLIRKQPTILIQDIESEIIPKIQFLKEWLTPIELTDILVNVSSAIIMSFHRLIRIAFIRQKMNKKSAETATNRINLRDFNVNRRNLHFVEKYAQNDCIWLYQILQLQPTAMLKVFSDYNEWIHAQIEENYYFHPLLAEKEVRSINEFGSYSEPILNLIDGESEGKMGMIEGETNDYGDEDKFNENQQKQKKEIERMKNHKTVRQIEILVGDIYKANTIRNALFR